MKKSPRREDPQYINVYQTPYERLKGPEIIHDIEARWVSHDARTGAFTAMVQVPPGWRFTERADEASIEFFVLEGDVAVNGGQVGCGGFIAIPKKCPAELASQNGAQMFLFWEPELPVEAYYDQQVQTKRVWEEPWVASDRVHGHGILYKTLRFPDGAGKFHGGPGGLLRLLIMAPGAAQRHSEVHHDCWEEMIFLAGEFCMVDRGFGGPGTLLSNPPEYPHGPYFSQRGAVMLFHTDAPIAADMETLAHGPEMTAHYFDTTSWLQPPSTEDWSLRPEREAWEAINRPTSGAAVLTGRD